jgi:hypothetical protein
LWKSKWEEVVVLPEEYIFDLFCGVLLGYVILKIWKQPVVVSPRMNQTSSRAWVKLHVAPWVPQSSSGMHKISTHDEQHSRGWQLMQTSVFIFASGTFGQKPHLHRMHAETV